MALPFIIDKQTLYQLAEWIITGIALVVGFRYLKEIIAYVLMELYRIFIQRGAFPL